MKKSFILIISIVALAVLSACNLRLREYSRVFKTVCIDVERHSEAYENLRNLCSRIGPRMTGTPGGAQAAQLGYMLFKSYGMDNVFFQEFNFNRWERGTLDLRMGPSYKSLQPVEALALAYSPSGTLKGQVVDMGNGFVGDYAKVNVEGKIVLFYRGVLPEQASAQTWVSCAARISYAMAQGAAGVMVINDKPGLAAGRANLNNETLKVPALCISQEMGMALKDSLKRRPYYASIVMKNTVTPAVGYNVVARMEGQERPEERIVVGAHLDTWDIAQGARDNGVGAVAVLDIARLFNSLSLNVMRTVDFVLFGAGEIGQLGAEAYVEAAKAEGALEKTGYMFNINAPGNACGFDLMRRYESESFFEEVGGLMAAADTCFANKIVHHVCLDADHVPFMLEGIPVFSAYGDRCGYEVYHTKDDNLRGVRPEMLAGNIRAGAMILYALANQETLPAPKFTDENTRRYLEENNLKDELILTGKW